MRICRYPPALARDKALVVRPASQVHVVLHTQRVAHRRGPEADQCLLREVCD